MIASPNLGVIFLSNIVRNIKENAIDFHVRLCCNERKGLK